MPLPDAKAKFWPPVTLMPPLAVSSPAALIVPEPVVEILPDVETLVVRASMPVSPVKVALEVTVTKLALIGAYLDAKAVPPSDTEANTAAPAVETDQLSSVMETLVEEDEPMVIVLATAPLPICIILAVVAADPI